MRYALGRTFQVLGMACLPLGVLIGFQRGDSRPELIYLGVGALLFTIGYVLIKPYRR